MVKENLSRKKYLFAINNLSIGGAEKLVVDQINYLYKNGYDINILTLVKSDKPNFDDRLSLPVSCRFFLDSVFDLQSLFKIFIFLKKEKPDVIFSHLFFSNTIVRAAAFFLFKKPKIIIYEHNNYEKEKKRKHLLIDKIFSFTTYKIVAVSEEVKRYLVGRGNISKKKIVVIKNGIDFSFLDKMPDVELKKISLGFDNDDKIVVSVGNVATQKGYDVLIETAKKIVSNCKDIKFLVCGNNNNKMGSDLVKRVDDYGLRENFIFLGSRKDVLEIVFVADVFCMPSRWEGLSIALLEAMVLGKAILTSDIESMRLILENGKNCLMFESENDDQLANRITELLNNDVLRELLGRKAAEKSKEYDIERNVGKLLNILDEK